MATEKKSAVRDPLLPLTHYQRIGKPQPNVKARHTLWLVGIAVLILLGSGAYFLHSEIEALKKDSTPTPLPTVVEEPESPAPTIASSAAEGKFCGGIAGIQCNEGLTCNLDGTYPDAGGTCAKEGQPTKPSVIPTIPIQSTPAPATPSEAMTM